MLHGEPGFEGWLVPQDAVGEATGNFDTRIAQLSEVSRLYAAPRGEYLPSDIVSISPKLLTGVHEAVAALLLQMPQLTVRMDALLDVPSFVMNRDGFLSGPQAGADPLDVARDFLAANRKLLGLTAADVANPVALTVRDSGPTGYDHVYMQQTHAGLIVYGAVNNMSISPLGQVLTLGNSFMSDVAGRLNTLVPGIAAQTAIAAVAANLGQSLTEELEWLAGDGGPSQHAIFSGGGISRDDIEVKLAILPMDDATARLVWNVNVNMAATPDWFDLTVDAATGEVLTRYNWTAYDSYHVFAPPSESPDDGAQSTISNPADPSASPFGWHDTNGAAGAEFTDTRGNNVTAQVDPDDDDNQAGFRPSGGAGNDYVFAFDPGVDPTTLESQVVTNLFFWNNYIHDVMTHHGFTSAAGNFQENTYGGGGIGSDGVNADAQDGYNVGDFDNANFATPPDGSNPRMQMYLWTYTNPLRDSDNDNGVIVHEYGHGITNRLVGGPANSNALTTLQSRGMGEGWSDWYALAFTAKPGDAGTDARGIGGYVVDDASGIRNLLYSTDTGINNYTYEDIRGLGSVHAIGEIWATTLWDLYWALTDRDGFDPDLTSGNGGNNLALTLVTEGLKFSVVNPSFLDARDGILAADVALTGGVNQCEIWEVFAARGMGFDADDGPSSNSTNVTNGFEVPPGVCNSDWGDAPDSYGTSLSANGPRHELDGPRLGTQRDVDGNGFPSIDALGDDTNASDDEDGLTASTLLIPGQAATFTIAVTAATAATRLDAWVDFDGNGAFGASERITSAAGDVVVSGDNLINFTVPSGATPGGTFARFRISESGGLNPTGFAAIGEVEDHTVEIATLDYGDAPDTYGTLLADDGPRHILSGATLGAAVDGEADGLPSAAADGDDADNADDEDGVTFGILVINELTSITFDVAGATANTRVDAFVDFDGDGDFGDPGERITPSLGLIVVNGANVLDFTVPASALAGTTFARVRISETGGLSPTGAAADGEVEDHGVTLFGQDFGDAPDSYGTLHASDGARHASRGPRLGASRDFEADGVPTSDADGDDNDNADDENGLASRSRFEPEQSASFVVSVANAPGGAFLDAFIDFNRDGDFTDAGERITSPGGEPVNNGANVIAFNLPARPTLGDNFLRLRLSSSGGLEPTGRELDGEVEDHAVLIERPIIATGPDVGQQPAVKLYDSSDLTQLARFFAFEQGFFGGVRVATGDVNGDGAPDIIVGRGPGGTPEVRVFDANTLQPLPGSLGSFLAFDADFKGGVMVAAGDVNGDGQADVIVGPDNGYDQESRPNRVRVFSGADGSLLSSFAPFGDAKNNRTGYRVASADFSGDGQDDVVIGTGGSDFNVRTKVKSFDMSNLANPAPIVNFKPFGGKFSGGVYVGAGDVDGDGSPDYILGQGRGGQNRLKVLSGANYAQLANFKTYNAASSGVRVAVAEFDDQPSPEILTGSGPGSDAVRINRPNGGLLAKFGGGFSQSGVFVAGNADAGEPASPIVAPPELQQRLGAAELAAVTSASVEDDAALALAVEMNAKSSRHESDKRLRQMAFSQQDFWLPTA